jgi:hypothetical protein
MLTAIFSWGKDHLEWMLGPKAPVGPMGAQVGCPGQFLVEESRRLSFMVVTLLSVFSPL